MNTQTLFSVGTLSGDTKGGINGVEGFNRPGKL